MEARNGELLRRDAALAVMEFSASSTACTARLASLYSALPSSSPGAPLMCSLPVHDAVALLECISAGQRCLHTRCPICIRCHRLL